VARVPRVAAVIRLGDGWTLPAVPSAVGQMRRRVAGFTSAVGVADEVAYAVALAVSETVTNAVIHAYAGHEPGPVRVSCRAEAERMVVEVLDEGAGVAARADSPGLGHGLAMVGALAQALAIEPRTDGPGTVVTMCFGVRAQPPGLPGLEPLCALALECLADVSCLDVASGGVLRRAAAEVAGDRALTAWLREAVPPAKPGTATWAALREGGHPSRRPRSERSPLARGHRRDARTEMVARGPSRRPRRDAVGALGPRRPPPRPFRSV
jgi:serine/threonine-protein kinase RsbW